MNEAKILALKMDLKNRAAKLFPGNEKRQRAYVWGTINRIKDAHK